MAAPNTIILGVNHVAPWVKKEKRISLAEVEKAEEQLKMHLKKDDLAGFGIPQFRIELFKLYQRAIEGKLPKKFELPAEIPREEIKNEKELLGLMTLATHKHGKEKAREILATVSPERMYFFELYSRTRELGYKVVGVIPASADRKIENVKARIKNQEIIDMVEIAYKEEEMRKYIASMGKIPRLIVTGVGHVSGKGLDFQLALRGISCKVIPIGRPLSRERIIRNSMARLRFEHRMQKKILKNLEYKRKPRSRKRKRPRQPRK